MKPSFKFFVSIVAYIIFSWLVMYILDSEYALSYKYIRFAVLSTLLYAIMIYFTLLKKK